MKTRLLKLFCVSGLAILFAANAHAQDLSLLKENESTYRQFQAAPLIKKQEPVVLVVEQELAEIIELAGRFNGYEVKFSSSVYGTLKDTTLPISIHKLLVQLGESFELKWHIRPKQIFVSNGSAHARKLLRLNGVTVEDLRAAVNKTDIAPDEYQLGQIQGQNTLILTGPASYVDGIAVIAEELNGGFAKN
ncbi:MAG: hypothetical protein AAGA76_15895, partial [Pseudomonadota bacterium]